MRYIICAIFSDTEDKLLLIFRPIYLKYFKQNIPNLAEVSIGHALIADALYLGLENTVNMYKDLLVD